MTKLDRLREQYELTAELEELARDILPAEALFGISKLRSDAEWQLHREEVALLTNKRQVSARLTDALRGCARAREWIEEANKALRAYGRTGILDGVIEALNKAEDLLSELMEEVDKAIEKEGT